jgi:uncharacterized protein (TIGR02757 family)
MKKKIVAEKLHLWYENFCRSQNLVNDFIAHDPVQFPRRFKKRADIEIAAFLAATIAWGRRDLILRSAQRMFALMEPNPSTFVMAGEYNGLNHHSRGLCIHRTFFDDDLKYFCKGFKSCYTKYGNLEKLFAAAGDIWQGISLFREEMAAANGGRYTKHIANPGANSACKRINLALRWLVRKGPVDLGLWKSITPAALYIPLDVHVARTARKIGLLKRKTNDKKAVIELTEKLREFCPEDPVKYDFALFGI